MTQHSSHTHYQAATANAQTQAWQRVWLPQPHGRKESTGIQHCIKAIAGVLVKSKSVHLIKFGGGGQVITLKSATSHTSKPLANMQEHQQFDIRK